MIRKLKNKKLWRLYSVKKIKVGNVFKRKNLGTFPSVKKAIKHEREVNYFKHR